MKRSQFVHYISEDLDIREPALVCVSRSSGTKPGCIEDFIYLALIELCRTSTSSGLPSNLIHGINKAGEDVLSNLEHLTRSCPS